MGVVDKGVTVGSGNTVAPEAVRALVGKNDWLFLCNDSNQLMSQLQGRAKVAKERHALYKNVYVERRRQFEDLGIPYILAIAPTKELIYGDKLPDGYWIDESAYPATMIRTIAEDAGLDVLCLRSCLMEAKKQQDVYYRTDTHWNDAGSYVVSEALIKRCQKYVHGLSIESLAKLTGQRSDVSFRGDLANKIKMRYDTALDCPVAYEVPPKPALFSEYPLTYESQNVDALKDGKVDDYLMVSNTRESVVKISEDERKPRILVYRDSFMTGAIKYLSSSFSRSVYLWTPDIDFDVVRRERPDIVVQVVADRFLVRVPRNKGVITQS